MSIVEYVGTDAVQISDGAPLTTGVTLEVSFDGGQTWSLLTGAAHRRRGFWSGALTSEQRGNDQCEVQVVNATCFPATKTYPNRPSSSGGGTSTANGEWRFNTATAAADPGSGMTAYNNATVSSVTAVYINEVTHNSFNFHESLAKLVTGDRIILARESLGSVFARFSVSGAPTDNGGWWTIPVSHIESAGTFGNNNLLRVGFHMERGLTDAEIAQVRQALGIDGTKVATSGGNLDDVKTTTDKILFTGGAVQSHIMTLEATVLTTIAKNTWDYLTSAATIVGSLGKLIVDNLDAAITSRQPLGKVDLNSNQSGVTIGAVGSPVTVGTNNDKSEYSLAFDQSGVTIGQVNNCISNADMRGTDGASTHNVAAVWAGMTNAAANKQADHIWRRDYGSIRASANGDNIAGRNGLKMMSRAVNRSRPNSQTGRIECYHEDDSSIYWEQVYSVDASASLITEMDTV